MRRQDIPNTLFALSRGPYWLSVFTLDAAS